MKRGWLNRKKGLARGRTKFRLSRLKGGKKTRENAKVNREKKQEHIESGITFCELRISKHCTPFDNLTWAHDRKRRHMGKWDSKERAVNMKKSVLACLNCHDEVELQGEAKMQPIIQAAIDSRPDREAIAA